MAITKIDANSFDLTDDYAFTGSISGAGNLVLLHSEVLSANTSSVVFDGYFSSSYQIYKFFIYDMEPNTEAARLDMLYRTSNANLTSAHYHYIIGDNLVHSAGTSATSLETGKHASKIRLTSEMKKTGPYTNSLEITLFDPLNTDRYKACFWHNQNFGNALTDLLRNYVGSAIHDNNTAALSGVQFGMDSGDIKSGTIFKLYGITT